jgi:deoxyadenosine/deoxycytidine kinase
MKKIICLLGVPGSGKTTLGNALKNSFSIPFFEEKFDSISSVSKERETTATGFEKCIGFLNMRYMQMQNAQASEAEMTFVDTCFEMTQIYSSYLLKEDEVVEFDNTFNIVNGFIVKPDLYVFLTGDLDIILKRALDRNLGLNLENTYLKKEILEESSNKISSFLQGKNFLEVDVTKSDLRDITQVRSILDQIRGLL